MSTSEAQRAGGQWPHHWGTESRVRDTYGRQAGDVTGREWRTDGHPQSTGGGTVWQRVGTQRDFGGTEGTQ